MIRHGRWMFAAILLSLLAACASPGGTLQRAGSSAQAFDMVLTSQMDWARIKATRAETWTIDGVALNQLNIYSQIKPGEHVLMKGKERKSKPDGPWFRVGMRPDEIRDSVADAYRELGFTQVEAQNLRPASFGGVDGYRFDLGMTEASGLMYQGTAALAVRNGKLDLLVWIAPKEHYFPRDIEKVQTMLDGLTFASAKP